MMEYQGKHKEACAKFESIEEEHLAQMITFTIQLASILEANIGNVDKVRRPFLCSLTQLLTVYNIYIYIYVVQLYTLDLHMINTCVYDTEITGDLPIRVKFSCSVIHAYHLFAYLSIYLYNIKFHCHPLFTVKC